MTSVSGHLMHFVLKNRQTVAGISMTIFGGFLPFGTTVGREINTTPVTREKIEIAPSHHVDNY